MIFLIIGLISLSRKSATGFASSADTVAMVAIVAVVVAASSGGRYLVATSRITGVTGCSIAMHSPSFRYSSSLHSGFDTGFDREVLAVWIGCGGIGSAGTSGGSAASVDMSPIFGNPSITGGLSLLGS